MSKAKLIRRTTGGICLVGALVMLARGETQPAAGGSPSAFVIYWLVCFLLAALAMLAAILDLRAVRREARQAQRSLFEETLMQIQTEKKQRQQDNPTPHSQAPNNPPRSRSGFQPDK